LKIDFHTHTTASDGTLTPKEIITEAAKKNIEYFAISDHDTIDGVKSLTKTPESINFITGVEISAQFPHTLHILGYGFDIKNEKLNATLEELQEYRKNRNRIILEKMEKAGFNITIDELTKEAGSDLIGRPHFANIMVRKGYVKTFREAFDSYLKKGAPLYMDKKRLDPEKAIKIIKEAGGVAVLAHPYQTKLDDKALENLIKKLCSYGLRGIEVFYSKHTPEMIKRYSELADNYSLMKKSGSDFHGLNKPETPLGMETVKEDINDFLQFAIDKRYEVQG